MKVVRTPQVEAQIKKYKRFLETAELANHTVSLNGNFYYSVQYWRFGKIYGYLVLRPDGEVVPREEAKSAIRLFVSHNLAVNSLFKTLREAKEKPVWMYQQKRDAIQALLPYYQVYMEDRTKDSIQTFLEVCQYVVDSQDRLRKMYEEAMSHHEKMMARGYAIVEDDVSLREILSASDYLLYERLKLQFKAWSVLDHLLAFLKKHKPSMNSSLQHQRKELIKLLLIYRDWQHKREAKKSIRTAETWTLDTPVPYESHEQMKTAVRKKNEHYFQHELLPLLRNP